MSAFYYECGSNIQIYSPTLFEMTEKYFEDTLRTTVFNNWWNLQVFIFCPKSVIEWIETYGFAKVEKLPFFFRVFSVSLSGKFFKSITTGTKFQNPLVRNRRQSWRSEHFYHLIFLSFHDTHGYTINRIFA